MDVKRYAVIPPSTFLNCPACGVYVEYDGGGEYRCPDCDERGFHTDMIGHLVFRVQA